MNAGVRVVAHADNIKTNNPDCKGAAASNVVGESNKQCAVGARDGDVQRRRYWLADALARINDHAVRKLDEPLSWGRVAMIGRAVKWRHERCRPAQITFVVGRVAVVGSAVKWRHEHGAGAQLRSSSTISAPRSCARVEVPFDFTVDRLHLTVQAAMGRTNTSMKSAPATSASVRPILMRIGAATFMMRAKPAWTT
jgi:hypothetical protein